MGGGKDDRIIKTLIHHFTCNNSRTVFEVFDIFLMINTGLGTVMSSHVQGKSDRQNEYETDLTTRAQTSDAHIDRCRHSDRLINRQLSIQITVSRSIR